MRTVRLAIAMAIACWACAHAQVIDDSGFVPVGSGGGGSNGATPYYYTYLGALAPGSALNPYQLLGIPH